MMQLDLFHIIDLSKPAPTIERTPYERHRAMATAVHDALLLFWEDSQAEQPETHGYTFPAQLPDGRTLRVSLRIEE